MTDVLQKFAPDDNTINLDALTELDPIIEQTNDILTGMINISVPQSLAVLHLNVINALEEVLENLNDIKSYNTDPIVSLSGVSKYETNATALDSAFQALDDAINQKLKS